MRILTMTHCTKMLLLHDVWRLIPILFHSKTHTNLTYDLGQEYPSNVGNEPDPYVMERLGTHMYIKCLMMKMIVA